MQLGALFVDRTGVVVYRCRFEAPTDVIAATLGDRAIGIVNLAHNVDRRIVNTIVVDMGAPAPARTYFDQPSVSAYGVSSLSVAKADLGLS